MRADKIAPASHPERRAARLPARRAPALRAVAGGDEVRITHPERVVFPDVGVSKGEVANYYREIAPLLLAGIADRPLSVVRCPDGIEGSCFFQKHRSGALGDRVRGVDIRQDSGKLAEYIYVDDAAGVMQLVQMNVLEFHPWGSMVDAPDIADRLVFDLDPAPDVTWSRVKTATRTLKDQLERLGLASFVRTSGGKGLHLVVPLKPGSPWGEAKVFSRAFAAAMTLKAPSEFIDVAIKQQRKGRIFIDYLRNARGATSVASYSLRARAGAPIAVPLQWSELARLRSPAAFDLRKVLTRVARQDRDPWEAARDLKQSIPSRA